MEASSGGTWKLWIKSLSNEDTSILSTWRGGAVWTQTRRHSCWSGPVQSCKLFGGALPSARHLWCSGTEARRQELRREFEVPSTWGSKQPRITTRAAATLQRSSALQVMACQMCMHVVKVGGAIHDQEDGRSCAPR